MQQRPRSRRLILAIETSNPSAIAPGSASAPGDGHASLPGVALAEYRADAAHNYLYTESLDASDPHRDDLMACIDRAFVRCPGTNPGEGAVPADLCAVAVSIGPGGFTSVRIAVTTARMIAEATGALCLPVPSALVVAMRAPTAGAPFAVALASKGDTAHVTLFDGGPTPRARAEGSIVDASHLRDLGVRCLIADRFLPPAMREEAARLGMQVIPPVFDPAACIEASRLVQPVDPLLLSPIYPREPEAVTKWRALGKSRH